MQSLNAIYSIERQDKALVVRFPEARDVLSWAVCGRGFVSSDTVVWQQVRNEELTPDLDPEQWSQERLNARGLADAVAFLTSHAVHDYCECAREQGGIRVHSIATVGLGNALRIGDKVTVGDGIGTINILCHLSQPLTFAAFLEAMSLAAEARTAACMEAHLASPLCGRPITGTGTDCIAIAAVGSERGEGYAGKHTAIGQLIGSVVYQVIKDGVQRWQERRSHAD